MRIGRASQIVFAATMVGLGLLGLVTDDFTPVWQPVPPGVPGRGLLVLVVAFISLGCGLGLLWQRTAAIAARVLLLTFMIWTVLLRVPELFPQPTVVGAWFGTTEIAVMVAGAWVLYVWVAADWDRKHLSFFAGERGLGVARLLFGLSLTHFGAAHFVYLKETVVLVPSWLPQHTAWAYFTGGAYIAAGVAIVFGVCARLAAVLIAVQIASFTFLVWLPIVAAGSKDAFQWSETIVSWALTAAAWVIADSYRNTRWFAVPGSAAVMPAGATV